MRILQGDPLPCERCGGNGNHLSVFLLQIFVLYIQWVFSVFNCGVNFTTLLLVHYNFLIEVVANCKNKKTLVMLLRLIADYHQEQCGLKYTIHFICCMEILLF